MLSRQKPHRFRDLVFWAEGGAVVVQNEGTGRVTILPVREFLVRLRALNRGNTREHRPDEREELASAVEAGIRIAREAKAQGDPVDPKVIADRMRHRATAVFSMRAGHDQSRGLPGGFLGPVRGARTVG